MTDTLRSVEGAAPGPDPDEKVRMVARMLLGMHRMTEIELGRRLGLPRTSIYNRMQGRTAFTVSEVVRMGQIFDIPPEAFLAGPKALLRPGDGSVTVRKLPRVGSVRPGARTPISVPGRASLVLSSRRKAA